MLASVYSQLQTILFLDHGFRCRVGKPDYGREELGILYGERTSPLGNIWMKGCQVPRYCSLMAPTGEGRASFPTSGPQSEAAKHSPKDLLMGLSHQQAWEVPTP